MSKGAPWSRCEAEAPGLAAAGRRLLYRGSDTASAYLATVAPDGGPRVHPVFPVLAAGELWLFIVDMSPKCRDLLRNGRLALHSMPSAPDPEEFHVRGHADPVDDPATKARVVLATEDRQGTHDFERLFRCTLVSALHTRWENWNSPEAWPHYAKWRA